MSEPEAVVIGRDAERDLVIVPEVTELTAPYWQAAADGRIALQRCRECGAVWHPPQPACPACRNRSPEWFDAAGTGVVHSYTVVRHAVHGAVAGRTPYVVCLVELDEGPRVICNLMGGEPHAIAVGMPVRMELADAVAGASLPQAVPRSPDQIGAQ